MTSKGQMILLITKGEDGKTYFLANGKNISKKEAKMIMKGYLQRF